MEVLVNGARLFYEDSGGTELVPVVFVHGFPFSHAMWEGQVSALKGKARTIVYDVRGHGKSEAGDGQYTLELFADDLLGLLDHLKLAKAVLCGLSMGGYIVLRAAQKAPQRAKALVLCDTRSEADTDEGKVKRAAAIAAVKRDGVRVFAENFVKAVFAPATLSGKPKVVDFARALIQANHPLGVCGALLAMAARTDTTAVLAKIVVPTLVMVGEHDALTPPAAAESLRDKIPGAKLKVLSGAAHMSNLENPAEFNAALQEFLSALA